MAVGGDGDLQSCVNNLVRRRGQVALLRSVRTEGAAVVRAALSCKPSRSLIWANQVLMAVLLANTCHQEKSNTGCLSSPCGVWAELKVAEGCTGASWVSGRRHFVQWSRKYRSVQVELGLIQPFKTQNSYNSVGKKTNCIRRLVSHQGGGRNPKPCKDKLHWSFCAPVPVLGCCLFKGFTALKSPVFKIIPHILLYRPARSVATLFNFSREPRFELCHLKEQKWCVIMVIGVISILIPMVN